jgi:hypothetical protein
MDTIATNRYGSGHLDGLTLKPPIQIDGWLLFANIRSAWDNDEVLWFTQSKSTIQASFSYSCSSFNAAELMQWRL